MPRSCWASWARGWCTSVAFVAVGLPIVSLLMLYGGLNPVNIFYVYMGTATLVLFVSGFSILISILAKRPRDAVLATYGLGASGCSSRIELEGISQISRRAARLGEAGQRCLAAFESQESLVDMRRSGTTTSMTQMWTPGWTSPIAASSGTSPPWRSSRRLCGVFFLVLAIAGLRPLRGSSLARRKAANRLVDAAPRAISPVRRLAGNRGSDAKRAAGHPQQIAPRAATIRCSGKSDSPAWEAASSGWAAGRLALFFIVLLGCYLFDVAVPAFGDLIDRKVARAELARDQLGPAVHERRVWQCWHILPISAAAASSLTSEREQDTWTSLATTLLTPFEIIRAKQFGADLERAVDRYRARGDARSRADC